MVDRASEVCGLVRVVQKTSNNIWWKDVVKAAVEKNGPSCKKVLGARSEGGKER